MITKEASLVITILFHLYKIGLDCQFAPIILSLSSLSPHSMYCTCMCASTVSPTLTWPKTRLESPFQWINSRFKSSYVSVLNTLSWVIFAKLYFPVQLASCFFPFRDSRLSAKTLVSTLSCGTHGTTLRIYLTNSNNIFYASPLSHLFLSLTLLFHLITTRQTSLLSTFPLITTRSYRSLLTYEVYHFNQNAYCLGC